MTRCTVQIRCARAARDEGRTTWHSFSFGGHYDPGNIGFGAITALNDELLPPGTGYPDHPHRDVEIVTLVLEGALRHSSGGSSTVLGPGELSRTSAGVGIVHAEVADSGTTRFLQTWLRPDSPGGPASYVSAPIGSPSDLTEVVGPAGVVGVGTSGARLYVAEPAPGRILLPDAPLLHVFSGGATLTLGERELVAGDAARLTGEGGRELTVEVPGPVLVWSQAR